MKILDSNISSFCIGRVLRENTERVNSIAFTPNGDSLITGSDDCTIVIYDSINANVKRTLKSYKYGVDLIRFPHARDTALYASTKMNDSIRYLSLVDNRYLRFFAGHTKRVVSLATSPVDDTFLTGSLDKTIRLWDIRTPDSKGLLYLKEYTYPVINYDPEGLIFAVGVGSKIVKLYDARSYTNGPFQDFSLMNLDHWDWKDLKFSPDGKLILLSTNGKEIYLIDAFDGKLIHTLLGHSNSKEIPLEASFTPDSNYVFSGSSDGNIYVWKVSSGDLVTTLKGNHVASVECVKFNPKYMMFASSCQNMAFWLPSPSKIPFR